MKKILFAFLVSLFCMTAASCTSANVHSVQPTAPPDPMSAELRREITVVGSGKIFAVPDALTVYIGVETYTDGDKLDSGREENAATVNRVLTVLKNADIREEEISTAEYCVSKCYDCSEESANKYRISQSIEFKTNAPYTAESLIAQLISAGVNRVDGICFGLKDPSDAYRQALEEAVLDAENKAKAFSETGSLNILKIRELNCCCYPYRSTYPTPHARIPEILNAYGEEGTTLRLGELTVEVTVEAVFEIR